MKKERLITLVIVIGILALVIGIFSLMVYSLKPEPEFYIGETGYYTREVCVESHTESKYGYHYGYNPRKGKFGYHYGHYTESVCDEYRTDTIEIK